MTTDFVRRSLCGDGQSFLHQRKTAGSIECLAGTPSPGRNLAFADRKISGRFQFLRHNPLKIHKYAAAFEYRVVCSLLVSFGSPFTAASTLKRETTEAATCNL